MGDVLPFSGFAQTVALNGARKDHCRRALVLHRSLIGGIHFAGIVTAEAQAAKRFVGDWLDQFQQPRIMTEEALPHVGAGLNYQLLVLAIHELAHALDQQAFGVAFENGIPLTTPEDLDDIPTGAAENGFELLNDLTVAANRTVKALQVAVDDENQ